ncbi:MAG: hypothetical protein ACRCT8_11995 [Lacipirellulaceae bacterium]
MPSQRPFLAAVASLLITCATLAGAADFDLYGRSGDAIAIDLASLPGIAPGSTFGSPALTTTGHSLLTSDTLGGEAFASSGRLWVFPNPARNTAALGDANAAARGFQGVLAGSVLVNGAATSFAVTVQPGYSGAGEGSVGQSLERFNGTANNPLFVAQQQQRLRYFGFVAQGGGAVPATGSFTAATDQAARTFQGAFLGGLNTTQASADGIIGPTTAGWLNARNAPQWVELIDPDPQTPGQFNENNLRGNFDLLPGFDSGGGGRTGRTPQPERFGTNWSVDLFVGSSALAKQTTGRGQLMNGMSTADGYGSSAFHSSHRVGMDIDIDVDPSTWNFGNGVLSTEESIAAQHGIAFATAPGTVGLARILTSNQDILGAINAVRPGLAVYDSSGGHQNHMHLDTRGRRAWRASRGWPATSTPTAASMRPTTRSGATAWGSRRRRGDSPTGSRSTAASKRASRPPTRSPSQRPPRSPR